MYLQLFSLFLSALLEFDILFGRCEDFRRFNGYYRVRWWRIFSTIQSTNNEQVLIMRWRGNFQIVWGFFCWPFCDKYKFPGLFFPVGWPLLFILMFCDFNKKYWVGWREIHDFLKSTDASSLKVKIDVYWARSRSFISFRFNYWSEVSHLQLISSVIFKN